MQSPEDLLAAFKKAYDNKKGAMDYQKFFTMLTGLQHPQYQQALEYVRSKSEDDYNTLITRFGSNPVPTAPPAPPPGEEGTGGRRRRKGRASRKSRKTVKKAKKGGRRRKTSKMACW